MSRWAALALAVALAVAPARPEPSKEPVIVFVLRHAEKAAATEDPGLSPEGVRRAEALAALLAEAGVTHLVATEFRRTQETLGPLAERSGLEAVIVSARASEDLERHLTGLAPGSVAVVAGHSNTVPAIVRALGGEVRGGVEALADTDYDRLFEVIRSPGAAVRTIELRYGP